MHVVPFIGGTWSDACNTIELVCECLCVLVVFALNYSDYCKFNKELKSASATGSRKKDTKINPDQRGHQTETVSKNDESDTMKVSAGLFHH